LYACVFYECWFQIVQAASILLFVLWSL